MSDENLEEMMGRLTPEIIEQHLRRTGWTMQERVLDHGDQRASLDIWTKTRNQETWEALAPTPGRPCSRSGLSMPVGQLAVMENRPHRKVLEEILQGEKR